VPRRASGRLVASRPLCLHGRCRPLTRAYRRVPGLWLWSMCGEIYLPTLWTWSRPSRLQGRHDVQRRKGSRRLPREFKSRPRNHVLLRCGTLGFVRSAYGQHARKRDRLVPAYTLIPRYCSLCLSLALRGGLTLILLEGRSEA
jgi:hypothetical protein